MDNSHYFPPHLVREGLRVMIFVDGENLAIRYKNRLGELPPLKNIYYESDIFVWFPRGYYIKHRGCEVIRHYYYTSVTGDENKVQSVIDRLKSIGIEAPRVFKKEKGKGTKRVDITLATDMLGHAHKKNYDIAVLVAGDEDYVPLVEAVKIEGCRVVLWFIEDGLSKHLLNAVDHYFDIGSWLLPK